MLPGCAFAKKDKNDLLFFYKVIKSIKIKNTFAQKLITWYLINNENKKSLRKTPLKRTYFTEKKTLDESFPK